MNSKEALERINNFLIKSGEQDYDFYSNQTVLIIPLSIELGIIKQDLDRLEKLEEENKVLLVNKNVAQGIAKKFKEENDKFKKAITLLKKKFVDVGLFIDCDDVGEYNFNRDSDEDRLSDFEFEFLKEVLESE